MIQLPDYILREVLTITKVLSERHPVESTRYKNAVRRAIILRRKLNKYTKK